MTRFMKHFMSLGLGLALVCGSTASYAGSTAVSRSQTTAEEARVQQAWMRWAEGLHQNLFGASFSTAGVGFSLDDTFGGEGVYRGALNDDGLLFTVTHSDEASATQMGFSGSDLVDVATHDIQFFFAHGEARTALGQQEIFTLVVTMDHTTSGRQTMMYPLSASQLSLYQETEDLATSFTSEMCTFGGPLVEVETYDCSDQSCIEGCYGQWDIDSSVAQLEQGMCETDAQDNFDLWQADIEADFGADVERAKENYQATRFLGGLGGLSSGALAAGGAKAVGLTVAASAAPVIIIAGLAILATEVIAQNNYETALDTARTRRADQTNTNLDAYQNAVDACAETYDNAMADAQADFDSCLEDCSRTCTEVTITWLPLLCVEIRFGEESGPVGTVSFP